MHGLAVLTLCVIYLNLRVTVDEPACIADLTTHLGIERSDREYYLIEFLPLLLHLAVAEYLCGHRCLVISDKLGLTLAHLYPVGGLDGGSIAGTGLLGLHLGVELLLVEGHAVLLKDELGEIEGESVCIIEHKGILARNLGLSGSTGGTDGVVENRDTFVEGTEERVLLLLDDLHYQLALCGNLGISLAHRVDEGVDQLIHECLLLVEEGICIAHGAAKDAADDISGLGIAGELRVGY